MTLLWVDVATQDAALSLIDVLREGWVFQGVDQDQTGRLLCEVIYIGENRQYSIVVLQFSNQMCS